MLRFPHSFCLALVAFALLAMPASGQVIITEIMYNPDSPEGSFPKKGEAAEPTRTEWLEIHNTGEKPVDISGWHLADEDGQTAGLPEDTMLAPGQTVVFIPSDCEVDEFKEAWGDGFAVYPLERWGRGGINNLANSPSEEQEVLELRNAKGETVDTVNYDDEGDWPSDRPDGPSIYLKRDGFDPTANDDPANWASSEAGTHGARTNNKTKHFSGEDIGSPGQVPAKTTEEKPVPMPADE